MDVDTLKIGSFYSDNPKTVKSLPYIDIGKGFA